MSEVGFGIVKRLSKLRELIDYKNIYKKEWFTSEIKSSLLENKNFQFEKAINFLALQVNQAIASKESQKRVFKKLAEFGVEIEIQDESSKRPKSRTPDKKKTRGTVLKTGNTD